MNKINKRITVFIVLGFMLLGISSSVWAADTSTDRSAPPGVNAGQNGPGQQNTGQDQTMLSQLVQDGIITQAEMDKILTYLEQKRSTMPTNTERPKDTTTGFDKQPMQPDQESRPDMWSEMVTAGLISQAQADAIKAKMDAKGQVNPAAANSSAGTPSSSSAGIGVKIDNQIIALNPSPQIVDGRTVAPLRGIFEALGLSVNWDAATQKVVGSKTGTTITLQINSKTASVNGSSVALDVPAKIINGSTYVPVRFIAESIGITVKWNAQDRMIEITTQ